MEPARTSISNSRKILEGQRETKDPLKWVFLINYAWEQVCATRVWLCSHRHASAQRWCQSTFKCKAVSVQLLLCFLLSFLLSVIAEAFVVYQRLVCSAAQRRLPGINHLGYSLLLSFINLMRKQQHSEEENAWRKKKRKKELCDMLACNI